VADLNALLRNEPALYENQFTIYGFEWVDLNHRSESIVSYRRKGKRTEDDLLVILNLTTVVRNDWEVFVNNKEFTGEIFNSDDKKYWGTGNVFNPEPIVTVRDSKEMVYELKVHLPPLGGIVLK